jgi:hypothetical protein
LLEKKPCKGSQNCQYEDHLRFEMLPRLIDAIIY